MIPTRFLSVLCTLTALMLVGCAVEPAYTTSLQVAQACLVRSDPYTKVTTLNGPRVAYGKYGLGAYLLSANRTGADKQSFLLVREWRTSSDGWMFLENAHDSTGHSLVTHVLSRDVGDGGTIDESLSVELPKGYLAAHAQSGLNIRLDGQKDNLLVIVPAYYVQGFLGAIVTNGSMSR